IQMWPKDLANAPMQLDRAANRLRGPRAGDVVGRDAMSDIKRRDFIALCGGAAVGWPLAARAQPAARMRRIGILLFAGREQEGISPFLQGLEALGSVTIEYRDA